MSPKLTEAAIFQNGYAVISREVDLVGDGQLVIRAPREAVLGTFWVTATDGVRISEVTRTYREVTNEVRLSTLTAILRANLDRTLTLLILDPDREDADEVEGTILNVGEMTILRVDGRTVALPTNMILAVAGGEDTMLWQAETQDIEQYLHIRATGPAGAKIFINSLESGMSWSPSFLAETSGDQVSLLAQATITNNIEEFENARIRLVTGLPNLRFLGQIDPMTESINLAALEMARTVSRAGSFARASDPQLNIPRGGMESEMALGAGAVADAFGDGVEATQTGDLFFYELPQMSLKRGDRTLRIVHTAEAEFARVFSVEFPPANFGDGSERRGTVWNTIRFRNTSSATLSAGPATIVEGGEILGQDLLGQIGAGDEVRLRISRTAQLIAEQSETLLNQETSRITSTAGGIRLVDAEFEGTISLQNLSDEAARIDVAATALGEVLSASDGGTHRSILQPGGWNSFVSRIQWTVTVPAGQTREVTYRYRTTVQQ